MCLHQHQVVIEELLSSVGSSPRGPLQEDTWASSQHGGSILREDGPRNRNWELPVFLKPQPGNRHRSLLPYFICQSHLYSGEGNTDISFNGRTIKEFEAIFNPP